MKKILLISIAFLSACGGSLTDEQRKKLHEGMEQQKIVKLSDSEITSSALDQGNVIMRNVEKFPSDKKKIDSVADHFHVKIRWIVPGTTGSQQLEQQLIEAYIMGMTTGDLQDNIQKLHTGSTSDDYDSLLYSRPVVSKMPDGTDQLEGIWNIYLSKKQVVLSAVAKK